MVVPSIISDAGERARNRFVEFFTANIRNRNMRAAYAHAVDGKAMATKPTRQLGA